MTIAGANPDAVIGGVDTHADVHVAAVVNHVGGEMPATNSDVARHFFELAQPPNELFEIDGGHFGPLYHDSPEFEASVEVQQDFLQRRLLGQIPLGRSRHEPSSS